MVSQCFNDVGNSGSFLSDSNIHAEELFLGISRVKISFLIDDGINSDSSLSSLPIPNNQLSLSSTDRDQTINSFQSSLHGFVD